MFAGALPADVGSYGRPREFSRGQGYLPARGRRASLNESGGGKTHNSHNVTTRFLKTGLILRRLVVVLILVYL